MKIFNEALSGMNKCFPSIPLRKRSRSDGLSTDRPNTLFPNDRSVLGSGIGKMGTQSHVIPSGFELEPQKPEERTKIAIPNKRTRTSMVDVKVCKLELISSYALPGFMFLMTYFLFGLYI